jgi:hypothetical protein
MTAPANIWHRRAPRAVREEDGRFCYGVVNGNPHQLLQRRAGRWVVADPMPHPILQNSAAAAPPFTAAAEQPAGDGPIIPRWRNFLAHWLKHVTKGERG